ncbi:hypothetical protein [Streptomyces sp. WMMC940]|uniref:hypothetical protein n=1 Tax=Streptomyces sp. WMMC940 TaxID=3015153 RepID=UPI0022B6FE93|nr:hypothetical protein [Streptomyces sp. WMMC940]MCZ7460686.1 hypothetical protein [Streptomyces sp. WMMC940]
MPPFSAGLHINVVSLGLTRRICAIWRVGSPVGQRPCEFSGALLLPRRGAEQRWAVETAVAALEEHGVGDGPACVDLTTTATGIELGAVRGGLCRSDLLELSRAALGDGHREWADLAVDHPADFRTAAGVPYVVLRHAATVTLRSPDGPGSPDRRVRLLHPRQQDVLRAYTAALLANTTSNGKHPDPLSPGRP